MKSSYRVIGYFVGGIVVLALTFGATSFLTGYLYLLFDSAAAHDGQGGISAFVLAMIVAVPATLLAGALWLIYSLRSLSRRGILPGGG